jgi:hypothetical protein
MWWRDWERYQTGGQHPSFYQPIAPQGDMHPRTATVVTAEEQTNDRHLACALLAGADPIQFGKLTEDLEHNSTLILL